MTEPLQKKYVYVVSKSAFVTGNPTTAWNSWKRKSDTHELRVFRITSDFELRFSDLIVPDSDQQDTDEFYQKHFIPTRTLQLEKIIADAEVELAALQVEAQ
jgi:hypothetical protein